MAGLFLKAKHWQIFIILIFGMLIANLQISYNPWLTIALNVVGAATYFLWPLAAGNFLQPYLPKKVKLNYDLYIINCIAWIVIYLAVMILTDGKGGEFNGLAALPVLYALYALMHSFIFPAKVLNTIEKGSIAKFGEYIGDFFLIIFLPVGIWFLQPRINKLASTIHTEETDQKR